jgi:hypothetical protein
MSLAINYEFEVSNSDIKKVERMLKIKIHDKYSPDTDFFSPIESNLKLNDAIDIVRSSKCENFIVRKKL